MVLVAWPGTIQTGPRTLRAPIATSAMSPLENLRAAAVTGPIAITLSQVILLSGFGSSCSQAMLANRPSQTVGSGWNTTSSSPSAGGFAASGGCGVLAASV